MPIIAPVTGRVKMTLEKINPKRDGGSAEKKCEVQFKRQERCHERQEQSSYVIHHSVNVLILIPNLSIPGSRLNLLL